MVKWDVATMEVAKEELEEQAMEVGAARATPCSRSSREPFCYGGRSFVGEADIESKRIMLTTLPRIAPYVLHDGTSHLHACAQVHPLPLVIRAVFHTRISLDLTQG